MRAATFVQRVDRKIESPSAGTKRHKTYFASRNSDIEAPN
jgi:hypothetical protein